MENERESTQQEDLTAGQPEDTPEIALGRSLRRLREGRGISQQDLANTMSDRGFSWRQTTVAKTEAGQRPVRVNEAVELARIFGIQPGDLLDLADDKSDTRRMLIEAQASQKEARDRVSRLERELEGARAELQAAERLAKTALKAYDLLRREELGWTEEEPDGEG